MVNYLLLFTCSRYEELEARCDISYFLNKSRIIVEYEYPRERVAGGSQYNAAWR